MKSNNLFIDEEYKQDCNQKIDLYKKIKNQQITNDIISDDKPTQNFSKKIGENLYKKLQNPTF